MWTLIAITIVLGTVPSVNKQVVKTFSSREDCVAEMDRQQDQMYRQAGSMKQYICSLEPSR